MNLVKVACVIKSPIRSEFDWYMRDLNQGTYDEEARTLSPSKRIN